MYRLQKIAVVLQEETIIISYISQVGTEMTWKISKLDSENQEVQTWRGSWAAVGSKQHKCT